MALLSKTPHDCHFYHEFIKDFLPESIIDCHTHIWLHRFMSGEAAGRSCLWPQMVARDNSVEDLFQTNLELFPGKKVYPVLYSHVSPSLDTLQSNRPLTAAYRCSSRQPKTCSRGRATAEG